MKPFWMVTTMAATLFLWMALMVVAYGVMIDAGLSRDGCVVSTVASGILGSLAMVAIGFVVLDEEAHK